MARVVFMGSPEFAVPSLLRLHDAHTLAGVVTQPDRPAGRGRRLAESAVKQAARDLSIPVIQPERLRQPEVLETLRRWAPEVIVVAAFGQILRRDVLDLPPHGCVNVHASLLPRHRGAAPVAAAILAGDLESGVTIMQMEAGLDTGPILSQRLEPIQANDTAGTLTERLAQLGADLLIETLPGYLAGAIPAQPQNETLATYARQLRKDDGRLDWTQPAQALERRVRAMQPWPVAFTPWQGQPLRVLQASTGPATGAPPGRVLQREGQIIVGAGEGTLILETVQPAGRPPMPAAAFVRGAKAFIGATLTNPDSLNPQSPVSSL